MAAGRGEITIAIDAGTSGARAVAVDLRGRVIAQARRPYPTRAPRPGWVEQDPKAWADRSVEALAAVVARTRENYRPIAIGLTGQCPTVAPFDRHGRALGPGLIYRDNRAVVEATQMRRRIGTRRMHKLTGHVAEPFHVGPKVLWLRTHEPAVFASTAVFLQPRDVVLRSITGVVATDETHANATIFFDLLRRRWSDELLGAFDLDGSLFPEALPPWQVAGPLSAGLARQLGLPRVPVVVGAGDSQCAAFGSGATVAGPISEMAGASTCINSAVDRPLANLEVTHYSHVVPDLLCTEVGVNTAGAAIEWGRSRLGIADHSQLEARALAFRRKWRSAAGRGSRDQMAPLFLPYLGDGDRTDPDLRGAFIGLAARHDANSLGFAVIEGVALAVCRTIEVLRRAGCEVEELRSSGGGAGHLVLAQVKADLLGVPVLRLTHDATAVGCALLAAAACGHAAQVETAIAAILTKAERVRPDPVLAALERRRFEWFEELLPTAAVHVPALPR